MVYELVVLGCMFDVGIVWQWFVVVDCVISVGMWLVVYMIYSQWVCIDGVVFEVDDFKVMFEGYIGGFFNMVLVYVGYLLMDVLDGVICVWMMGQGYCVVVIDVLNVLVGNMIVWYVECYDCFDVGLSWFVGDFYVYIFNLDGILVLFLGFYVNVYIVGGVMEGGYFGFVELQYVYVLFKDECLVVFFSDGVFEEQCGSDWVLCWWCVEDSGLVSLIIIFNGWCIEQCSQIVQQGGEWWLDWYL